MNKQVEIEMETIEEECCEYCLGTGLVEIDADEYDCEYCEIYECSYSSDNDSDYIPNWSEDNDTEEDSYSDSDIEDCGLTCNECVCYCGSV